MSRNPRTLARITTCVARPTSLGRGAVFLALLVLMVLPAARAHASHGAPSQVLRALQSVGKSIVRAIEEEAPTIGVRAARVAAKELYTQQRDESPQVSRVAPANTRPMDATACRIALLVIAVAIRSAIVWAVRGSKRSQPLPDGASAPPTTVSVSVLPPLRIKTQSEPWRAPPSPPALSRTRRNWWRVFILAAAVLCVIPLMGLIVQFPLTVDEWAGILLGAAFVALVFLFLCMLGKFESLRTSSSDPES